MRVDANCRLGGLPTRRDLLIAVGAVAGSRGSWAGADGVDGAMQTIASRLAAVYPVNPTLGYVSALILSAQRRLDRQGRLPPRSQALLQQWRDTARDAPPPADWPQRAGHALFAEAARADGDDLCRDLARAAALTAIDDTPAGPRLRGLRPLTDDMFMATLLLDRTLPLLPAHEQTRAAEALAGALHDLAGRLQRPCGLFDHAERAPVAWGRGNGFASLALAWALAGPLRVLPEARVAPLRTRLVAQLQALRPLQGDDGLWRQVLDVPDSAPELTVTAMVVAAGVSARQHGWVVEAWLDEALHRAQAALAQRVDPVTGNIAQVCTSTPAGPTLDFYLQRPIVRGRDDRAAAMVMQAAVALGRSA